MSNHAFPVLDGDLGKSGTSTSDREDIKTLVADVSLGKAGAVLAIEASRQARSNADWHRLIEICGITGTWIIDEDRRYDPCDSNDGLLLGLKGTMAQTELQFTRARLQGNKLNKTRKCVHRSSWSSTTSCNAVRPMASRSVLRRKNWTGRRLTPHYQGNGGVFATYQCNWRKREDLSTKACMTVQRPPVDRAIEKRVLEVLRSEQAQLAIDAFGRCADRCSVEPAGAHDGQRKLLHCQKYQVESLQASL